MLKGGTKEERNVLRAMMKITGLRDVDVYGFRSSRRIFQSPPNDASYGYPFTVNNNHSIIARDVHVIRCLP